MTIEALTERIRRAVAENVKQRVTIGASNSAEFNQSDYVPITMRTVSRNHWSIDKNGARTYEWKRLTRYGWVGGRRAWNPETGTYTVARYPNTSRTHRAKLRAKMPMRSRSIAAPER